MSNLLVRPSSEEIPYTQDFPHLFLLSHLLILGSLILQDLSPIPHPTSTI